MKSTMFRRLSLDGSGAQRIAGLLFLKCTLLWMAFAPGVVAAQTSQSAANFGSVPTGTATNAVLHLTLRDAINRAVLYNLGQIESGENGRIARGQRLRALSALLPQVRAAASENVEQFSATTLGIKVPQVPAVIGPFSYSTAQANVSQTLFSFESIQRFRAASSAEQAAQLAYSDTLDLTSAACSCIPSSTILLLRETILPSRSPTFRVPSACPSARSSIWPISCRTQTSIRRPWKMP